MEPIEFCGITIKPSRGSYRCPFGCGDPRYPPQKWKTEKGFRAHLEKCPKRPGESAAPEQPNGFVSQLFACGKHCPHCGDKIAYTSGADAYTCFTCGIGVEPAEGRDEPRKPEMSGYATQPQLIKMGWGIP